MSLTVIAEFHVRVVGQAGVEVGHQWSDVLGGSEPRMHVVACVQESSGCDGDVPDGVAIVWKIKRQQDRL